MSFCEILCTVFYILHSTASFHSRSHISYIYIRHPEHV